MQTEITEYAITKSAVRKRAQRMGFSVQKSRQFLHANNHGLFRLIDAYRNFLIAGENFDLSLEEIAYLLEGEGESHVR